MENKNARFKRLGEQRVNNCLKNLRLIGNLSNKRNYTYTESDIKKIFKTLRKSLSECESRFTDEIKENFKL